MIVFCRTASRLASAANEAHDNAGAASKTRPARKTTEAKRRVGGHPDVAPASSFLLGAGCRRRAREATTLSLAGRGWLYVIRRSTKLAAKCAIGCCQVCMRPAGRYTGGCVKRWLHTRRSELAAPAVALCSHHPYSRCAALARGELPPPLYLCSPILPWHVVLQQYSARMTWSIAVDCRYRGMQGQASVS
jgi:hypothetical protein